MSAVGRAFRRVAKWWRDQEAAPVGGTPWMARQVKVNLDRIEELAEHQQQLEARVAAVFAAMDAAARAAGLSHPDMETTMPQLRVHHGGREAG